MKKRIKITAMIPARIGSERLKFKNLALLNNRPLIYYVINSAKKSKVFDNIYINSDHKIFEKISKRYKINFYKRSKKLGGSNIESDIVVNDFIQNIECDILVWINPIAPLQTDNEIKKVVNYFSKSNYDSLITSINKQVHAKFKNKPINYKTNQKFKKTQDLKAIELMVYSLMMWKSASFKKNFNTKKHGILCGKSTTYEVDNLSGLIVKYDSDLRLIENIMSSSKKKNIIKYDHITKLL